MSTTSNLDLNALALELLVAYSDGAMVSTPPSTRDANFDMTAAYEVEAELVRLRKAAGKPTVGRKVGFANKAMWRALHLETLVWAHMYDDTVQYSAGNMATLSLARMFAPKIEPEIVFKLKEKLDPSTDPTAILERVEWLALGFEIVDCAFPDWQFQPVDFVAAFGFHAALVVGEPRQVEPGLIPVLADQLPRFKVRLLKGGQLVDEGSGRNSLRSPALCLGELAAGISRQSGAIPLAAGELISSGTLTTPALIAAGEDWSAELDGLDLPSLTLRLVA